VRVLSIPNIATAKRAGVREGGATRTAVSIGWN
jgi:hypothetical protein